MKRRYYLALVIAILCGVVLLLFWKNQPDLTEPIQSAIARESSTPKPPAPPSQSDASLPPPNPLLANQETQEQKLNRLFSYPINFYGKVIDEHGNPVEGAQVRFSAPSYFLNIQQGSQDGPASGPDGRFSITGKTGAGIQVSVSHPKYYSTDRSHGQFTYFENTEQNPSESSPAVFVLRKKGDAEPLVKDKQVLRNVPKSGQPVRVGLSSKSAADLTIQAWTSPRPAEAANNAPFDWKVRVEVPGGGLVAYEDAYQFEAPAEGYAPSVEFAMPAGGVDGKWRDRFDETFFVKLANGNYARMRFQMIAGGSHFAVVESYYNPSGSRNLEYDPSKTASANP